jgi:TetR/AcrR family transcriptional regulator, transcriptional repressor for nem operon
MKKGEATRKRIVARTANLLNTHGYLVTPVSEIMRAVGLQKGGIYRHFASRNALAREAFEYAVARIRDRCMEALQGKKTAAEKLYALFEVARNASHEESYQGGCPMMNLAVESDDVDPELRKLARDALTPFVNLFERVIAEGTENGEFALGDPRTRAICIVASLEGALMLSNLYKDRTYVDAVADDLISSLRNALS